METEQLAGAGPGRVRRVFRVVRSALSHVRTLTGQCRPYRLRLVILIAVASLAALPPLLTPGLLQQIVDRAYPARNLSLLLWLCLGLAVNSVTDLLLGAFSGYYALTLRNGIEYRLFLRLFGVVQRMPPSRVDSQHRGLFIERLNADVSYCAMGMVQGIAQLAGIVFTFLTATVIMGRMSIWVTVVVLAALPINYVLTLFLGKRLRDLGLEGRAVSERIMTLLSESISGHATSQVFAMGPRQRHRLAGHLRDRIELYVHAWRASTVWGRLSMAVSSLWGCAVLAGGWYLVFVGHLQLGQAMAMAMYIGLLQRPFQQLGELYRTGMTLSVSAERVFSLMQQGEDGSKGRRRLPRETPLQHIEVRDLAMRHPNGTKALDRINLSFQRGQTIAIVGPTGAGKSTLLKILAGLEDRYDGKVLVDGLDLREVSRRSYLQHVALASQDAVFFHDSLRNNLCLKRDQSSEQIDQTAAALGVRELLERLPEGLQTQVGSGDVRFSTGQYQQLSLLRAMLKDASLLLLDEGTSGLDVESERRMLNGVMEVKNQGCITLIVSHHIRITTEPWIDRVLFLSNGRIIESGPPQELCQRNGPYRSWLAMAGNGAGGSAALRAVAVGA